MGLDGFGLVTTIADLSRSDTLVDLISLALDHDDGVKQSVYNGEFASFS